MPKQPGKKMPKALKIVLIVLGALLALLLVLYLIFRSVILKAFAPPTAYEEYGSRIPIAEKAQEDPNVKNILVIGTDSRISRGGQMGGNSDTIIVATYDAKKNNCTLTSIMRDAYMPISGMEENHYDKLKAAYRLGGIGCLINTINDIFGLDVQKYVAVGLDGFIRIVDDVLGGLDMELTQDDIDFINTRITEYENESDLVKNAPQITDGPGIVHLTGAQALIFARNRTASVAGGDGSDYDRASRQQTMLRLMYRKLLDTWTVSDIPGILQICSDSIETNLSPEEIIALAIPFMGQEMYIRTYSVPFPGTWHYGKDGTGIKFNKQETAEMLHEILYTNGE